MTYCGVTKRECLWQGLFSKFFCWHTESWFVLAAFMSTIILVTSDKCGTGKQRKTGVESDMSLIYCDITNVSTVSSLQAHLVSLLSFLWNHYNIALTLLVYLHKALI